jgi:hypothetical protein
MAFLTKFITTSFAYVFDLFIFVLLHKKTGTCL